MHACIHATSWMVTDCTLCTYLRTNKYYSYKMHKRTYIFICFQRKMKSEWCLLKHLFPAQQVKYYAISCSNALIDMEWLYKQEVLLRMRLQASERAMQKMFELGHSNITYSQNKMVLSKKKNSFQRNVIASTWAILLNPQAIQGTYAVHAHAMVFQPREEKYK